MLHWAGRIHQNYTNQSAVYMETIDTMLVLSAELPGISRLGGAWEWIAQAPYKSASAYHKQHSIAIYKQAIYLSIYLSIYISIYLSIYLSMFYYIPAALYLYKILSIYLLIYLLCAVFV